ncbi:unnamed protein product [Cunninghamella echinulata]
MSWLNTGVIILLTSFITFITLYPTVAIAFQFTENQLISLCNQINQAVYQINQFPFFINQYIQQAHQSTHYHLKRFVLIAIDVIKYVILWIIDMYKSVYRCLFAFAINTVLALLTSIMKPLQDITESVLKGIDTVVDSIGSSLFNMENGSSIPTTLSNWTLSMEQTQQKVKQWTMGTETLHEWISLPFTHLQQQINSSFVTMNNTDLPTKYSNSNNNINMNNQSSSSSFIYNTVIKEEGNSSYCNITTIIHHLHETKSSIQFILHMGLVVLIVLIVFCIVLKIMYLRYRHFYLQRLRFQVVDAILSKSNNNHSNKEMIPLTQIQKNEQLLKKEMVLAYYGDVHQSPLLFSMLNKFSSSFTTRSSSSYYSKWQQWLFYITQSSAFMYCLYIGVIGLIVSYTILFILQSYFQTTVIPILDHNINQWMATTVQQARNFVQTDLDNQWQTTNQWINTSETIMNNYLFGSIRDLAVPLNTTLENTINHLSELISNTVDNTIMEQPAKEVINCLFLTKMENIQQGIEWIIKNSYIEFPRLKLNVPATLSFHLMEPVTSKSIFDIIEKQLKQQIMYYWILVGLWFISAFIGFIYIKKYSL